MGVNDYTMKFFRKKTKSSMSCGLSKFTFFSDALYVGTGMFSTQNSHQTCIKYISANNWTHGCGLNAWWPQVYHQPTCSSDCIHEVLN